MDIGSVIKKYRKEIGLTQEEMANRLGVTTPAVNKWENGNSNPDIELLAPIARLLNISLDTLLSFQENLTGAEIEALIVEMDCMFSKEGFEKTYEWALDLIKKYPNCNILIWQIALMLDARRMTGACEEPEQYDEQINAWYERALHDENEEIRHRAAESLFGFHLRKKNYAMAENYLNYFSDYDPMKKVHKGRLYKEQGKIDEAYEMFEDVLFSEYGTLNLVFSKMASMALEQEDSAYAKQLAEKAGMLAHIFDWGKYNEYAPMLDIVCAQKNVKETYEVVNKLLESVESLYDFQKARLYKHKKWKETDGAYLQVIKEKLLEGFRDAEDFGYMKGYEPWEKLIYK